MTRDEVITRIKPHEADLRAAGISGLYLFGSVARNEAGGASDLDLMCDLDPERPLGLFTFSALQLQLEQALHVPVDLVPRRSMRPGIRQRAEAEMVRLF